jgi:hypothetical protein
LKTPQPGDVLLLGEKRPSLNPVNKSSNILLSLFSQLTLKRINTKLYTYSRVDTCTQLRDMILTAWCLIPTIDSSGYISDVPGGCIWPGIAVGTKYRRVDLLYIWRYAAKSRG